MGEPSDEATLVEIPAYSRPDGRAVWRQSDLTAADLPSLQLDALSPEAQALALDALNGHVAPCLPCIDDGHSLARCVVDAHPSTCDNLPPLAEQIVAAASGGADADALSALASFSEPWIPIGALDAPRLGSADAPVNIVAAIDYQSPFTARAAQIWSQLLESRGEEISLQIVYWFDEDRHPNARAAARAALAAAEQGKFWELHGLLVENYNALDDANLQALAAEAGLDVAAWQAARSRPELDARIDADRALTEGWGVRSAPTVFIGGYMVRGARPAPELERYIDLGVR